MLKKRVIGLMAAVAVLAAANMAAAAEYNINIYGASAQHKFWSSAAPAFLADTTNGLACSSTAQATKDSKNGITKGEGCTVNGVGGNTVYIRYASQASYDGIEAVMGVDNNSSQPCSAQGQEYRQMVDETSCNWSTKACTALKCVDVNLGASDVAGASFIQTTSGWENGKTSHDAGEDARTYSYNAIPSPATYANPIIVPFGFMVNKSVTETRCTAPRADNVNHKAYTKEGWRCVPDGNGNSSDCIGNYACVSGLCAGGVNAGQSCTTAANCPDAALTQTSCVPQPLDNLTRQMALHIFSNQVDNWQDFGPYYPDLPIVKCLRHAGSGTHATIDLAVFRGDASIFNQSDPFGGSNGAKVWHYRSSSDLVKCVNTQTGGVGYADADQVLTTSSLSNVNMVKYEGYEPSRKNIVNGSYNFWAAQYIYWDATDTTEWTTELNQIVGKLMAYASSPANINETTLGAAANYWAAQGEMKVTKTNDFTYPIRSN
jgi:opacity protein-like surface antigen